MVRASSEPLVGSPAGGATRRADGRFVNPPWAPPPAIRLADPRPIRLADPHAIRFADPMPIS